MSDVQLTVVEGDIAQVIGAIPGPQGPAGAVAAAIDGSAALPSIAFASDTDTGLYRVGANQLGVSTGGTQRLVIDETGQIEAASLGTQAAPTWTFVGDPNTGIYSPGADQLALATNGAGRLFVDASGRVGIATSSPVARLHVSQGADSNIITYIQGASNGIRFGTNTNAALIDGVDATNGTTSYQPLFVNGSDLRLGSGGVERARIDSSGRFGIGTSSPEAGHLLQANGIIASLTSFGGFTALQAAGGAGFRWTLNNDSTFRLQRTANGFSSSTTPILIDSSDRVGIGTASPGTQLEVALPAGTGTPRVRFDQTSDNPYIELQRYSGTVGQHVATRIRSGGNDASLVFERAASAPIGSQTFAESARIDSSGRLLVGTSSSINTVIQAGLQLQSSGANAYLSVGRWDNNAANPGFIFNKSRGASPGTRAVVQAEDSLGQIAFTGDDGSAFVIGAEIKAAVDGTPGANDMPGRLVFSTTADGAASPTERLRITSAGVLQIADAGNIAVGTTTGTKIGTATTQKLGFFNKTPVTQPAAVADATDAASVITQLNALLARMRDLGLIAT